MNISHGRVESFHNDQIVVALPHLNIVAAELNDLGATFTGVHRHNVLGLAKVSGLDKLGDAVERVRLKLAVNSRLRAELDDYEKTRAAEIGKNDLAPLDVLLMGLRLLFADKYAGWTPVFGKNRGRVAGAGPDPHWDGPPIGAAVGYPEPNDRAVTSAAAGGGSGVRVGLLDTRIFPTGLLAGHYRAWPHALIDRNEQDLYASAGHGTFTASCILRQAPAAELDVRRVLGDDAIGDTWDAAVAMVDAAESGADIVNVSLGQWASDDNQPPLVLETAVNLVSRRAVIVAAAGNHGDPDAAANPAAAAANPAADIGPKSPVWPAACLGVIAVGALDQDRKPADFSPDVPWVSLLATAVDVTGDYLSGEVIEIENDEAGRPTEVKAGPFNGTAKWNGTSFAAAAVSGKLAAHTIPGVRSAREALNDLLQPGPPLLANGIWFCVPER